MPAFSPDAGCTLTTSLVAYWKLGEASGSRADSVGSNTLTDINTVTQAAGKVGNAAQFTSANSEYLSIADNAALSTGDIDFTIACWVYMDSDTAANQMFVAKYDTGTANREYVLYFSPPVGTNRFTFIVSSDGAATVAVIANNFGAPATGTWYFLVAWHDSVANTVNISVNNGTVDSLSTAAGVFNSTAAFHIGARSNPVNNFVDGRVDEVSFWKKVLTAQEITDLYNGGSGNTYDSAGTCTPASVSGMFLVFS